MGDSFPNTVWSLWYYVMLIGLSNAVASFYDYINNILAKKYDIFIMVYPDNILIFR